MRAFVHLLHKRYLRVDDTPGSQDSVHLLDDVARVSYMLEDSLANGAVKRAAPEREAMSISNHISGWTYSKVETNYVEAKVG